MDQPPTRSEFNELREEQRLLKEQVRQLKEQRTEEIKAVRVEVASEDVIKCMERLEQSQQKLLKEMNEKFEQVIWTQRNHSEKFDTLEHQIDLIQGMRQMRRAWT